MLTFAWKSRIYFNEHFLEGVDTFAKQKVLPFEGYLHREHAKARILLHL